MMKPPEEMPEHQDHAKNTIGKVRINPCAKSFILCVYDVSARYTDGFSGNHIRVPQERLGGATFANAHSD